MLTKEENEFLKFWGEVRIEYSETASKVKRGIPAALLFSLSILLSLVLVFFFSPEWYTKISQQASGSTIAILVAIILTAFFFSYIRMHYQWEMNEQYYQELKHKLKQKDVEKQNTTI
jgi:uncharacterized membrane protein (DUF485 family)